MGYIDSRLRRMLFSISSFPTTPQPYHTKSNELTTLNRSSRHNVQHQVQPRIRYSRPVWPSVPDHWWYVASFTSDLAAH